MARTMLRSLLLAISISATLGGCARNESPGAATPGAQAAPAAPTKASTAARTLAYEYGIEVNVDADRVEKLYQSVQRMCRDAAADDCAILEARLEGASDVTAMLKLRARSATITAILANLRKDNNVVRQTVKAEDLAEPMADATNRMVMLEAYRTQLEGLLKRPGGDIDVLMKVTKEIADVQSSIEALATEKSRMDQRVQTDLLSIDIVTHDSESVWQPVASAVSGIQGNLAMTLAAAVMLLGIGLPWAAAALAAIWLVRLIRARCHRSGWIKAA